jgi:hypothetical protein
MWCTPLAIPWIILKRCGQSRFPAFPAEYKSYVSKHVVVN